MSDPKVISVIIPNYNGLKFIETCIQSVLEQSKLIPDIEIIVVDNASHDESVVRIRRSFPDVVLRINDQNLGFTVAVNQGVEIARGDWVLLLNNDTKMLPGSLAELCRALRQAPDTCGGVQPLLIRAANPELIDSAGIHIAARLRASDWLAGEPVSNVEDSIREIWGACAACALLRKTCFNSCGGFDPDYFADFDDVDFSLRARWLGYHFLLVPTARVLHYRSSTQRRAPGAHLTRHRRNELLTILKSLPRGLRGRTLLYRFQRDLFMLPHYLRKGEADTVLAAWCESLNLARRMFEKRRDFLSRAKLSHQEMRVQLRQFGKDSQQ